MKLYKIPVLLRFTAEAHVRAPSPQQAAFTLRPISARRESWQTILSHIDNLIFHAVDRVQNEMIEEVPDGQFPLSHDRHRITIDSIRFRIMIDIRRHMNERGITLLFEEGTEIDTLKPIPTQIKGVTTLGTLLVFTVGEDFGEKEGLSHWPDDPNNYNIEDLMEVLQRVEQARGA